MTNKRFARYPTIRFSASFSLLSFFALSMPWIGNACQSEGPFGDPEAAMHVSNRAEQSRTQTQTQNIAPSQLRKVTIHSTSHLAEEQLTAISQRLERQAKVDKVRVAVQEHKQEESATTTLEVLLEGSNFPEAELLKSDLLHSFPELAQAEISVMDDSSADFGTPFDQASEALMKQESLIEQEEPEIAEQIIRDQLQEQLLKQGIEDDQVQVQVHDDERGRQVEVRIEKHP